MTERILVDQVEETSLLSVRQVSRTIVFGGVCVGTLDGLAATMNAGIKGVGPDKVFHYIASGLIGPDLSYNGGAATVVLGLLLHFAIAFGVVAIFLLLGRSFPSLPRRAAISGAVYGVVVYFVMSYLIVPLSAASSLPFSFSGMVTGIAIHISAVGLPTAIIAQRSLVSHKNY